MYLCLSSRSQVPINGCGTGVVSYVYWFSFQILINFVMLNLIVFYVLDSFNQVSCFSFIISFYSMTEYSINIMVLLNDYFSFSRAMVTFMFTVSYD